MQGDFDEFAAPEQAVRSYRCNTRTRTDRQEGCSAGFFTAGAHRLPLYAFTAQHSQLAPSGSLRAWAGARSGALQCWRDSFRSLCQRSLVCVQAHWTACSMICAVPLRWQGNAQLVCLRAGHAVWRAQDRRRTRAPGTDPRSPSTCSTLQHRKHSERRLKHWHARICGWGKGPFSLLTNACPCVFCAQWNSFNVGAALLALACFFCGGAGGACPSLSLEQRRQ